MASRGFGIAGALDLSIVRELASGAERAGYTTFWANDTPGGDGLIALAAAAERTSTIQLGVGVIPIDRRPATEIAAAVVDLNLPEDRLIVGIGSGGLTSGARDAVRNASIELRGLLKAKVVVGALGPRMCEIGGEAADGALLNWITAGYAPVLSALTRRAASGANRSKPWIGAYVRVALDGPGLERLSVEAERYASFPQYAAHFERMGVEAIETCSAGSANEVQASLGTFPDDLDEVVVRAIAATESMEAYLDVLQAAAPDRPNEPA